MKKKILGLFSFLLLLILPITIINADSYVSESGGSEEVNHSYFVAGNTLNTNDKVHGLSFVAGNSVTVKGEAEYGFYVGNILNVSGKVEKDLFAAGNMLNLEEVEVGRDVYLAGSDIIIKSNINGNAFIGANQVTLNNITINGDLNIGCANLVIEGSVNITGKLKIDEDTKISGEENLTYEVKETYNDEDIEINVKSNIFVDLLVSIATLLVLAFIINALLPKLYDKVNSDNNLNNTFKNILFGLIGLVVIPLASLILLLTVVGLMTGLVMLLLYLLMLCLATIISSMVIGNLVLTKLFKVEDNSYLAIIIGIALIKVVSIIPYIGGLVGFITFTYGIGKLIELFNKREK